MSKHTRRAALYLFGAALAGLMPSAQALAASKSLRGTVSFRERIALPPSAILDVRLVDVSRADGPARMIARARVRIRGRVPIPYRLVYDSAKIKKDGRYALQARIAAGGKLWFTTTRDHPVFTGAPDETNIMVQRVSGNAPGGDDDAELTGSWLAENILGGGVIDRLQTVLEIEADGRVTGTGGCNRFTGSAKISGNTVRFAPLISTRMACAPAAMDQEQKFFRALDDVRRWEIYRTRRKLALFDDAGKPLVILARM